MVKIHHYLWPHHIATWNHWSERRFRAHCENWRVISLASGAGAGKSLDCAKIGIIEWICDPLNVTVVVASTTLESLENRIWGYVVDLLENAAMPVPKTILTSQPPKILLPKTKSKIHGMFAIAMAVGDDDKVISKLIGRHPKKKLVVFLDECTDMNAAISKAIPNLEKGVEFFQLYAIGNSKSRNDLHGALSTPEEGWDSIDPNKTYTWKTTHKNGLCLYFHPEDSPAITDPDPKKRAILSKFLITRDTIKEDQKNYGIESDAYWRFTLGYWKKEALDQNIFSEKFVTEQEVMRAAEWSGYFPLQLLAALDPAIQIGGMGCKLRLGILGQTTDGAIVLDANGADYLFTIHVRHSEKVSGERQIANEVCKILSKYRVKISNLVIDATGIGRSLGELISIVSGTGEQPIRIVSTRVGDKKGETDPFIVVSSPSEMWFEGKKFIQHRQIKGIDKVTQDQLTNRLMFTDPKTNKSKLESKEEFKSRMGAIKPSLARSPDEVDTLMLMIKGATLRFGFTPGQRRPLPAPVDKPLWLQKAIVNGLEVEQRDRMRQVVSRPALVAKFSSPIESLASPSVRQRPRYQ